MVFSLSDLTQTELTGGLHQSRCAQIKEEADELFKTKIEEFHLTMAPCALTVSNVYKVWLGEKDGVYYEMVAIDSNCL